MTIEPDYIRATEILKEKVKELSPDKIFELFSTFGKVGAVENTLHPGKRIIRGRLLDYKTIKNSLEMNYCPPEYNKSYGRASSPEQTMFYGMIEPSVSFHWDFTAEKYAIATEISQLLRNNIEGEPETLLFGIFEVVMDIHLFPIFFRNDWIVGNEYMRIMSEEFHKFMQAHPEHVERTLFVQNYLAEEFSKEQINNQEDYKISALWTERILALGSDGVIYPSVRSAGRCYCVAIKPEIIDDGHLQLVRLEAAKLYKKGNLAFIQVEHICENPDTLRFEEIATALSPDVINELFFT